MRTERMVARYQILEIGCVGPWTDIYGLNGGYVKLSRFDLPTPLRMFLQASRETENAILPEDWGSHVQWVYCSWCNEVIRTQEASHPGAEISHGICKHCVVKIDELYSEVN